MNIKAIFHRKEPELDLKDCLFERVVFLPDDQYRRFQKNVCPTQTINYVRNNRISAGHV